ncbi:PcfJ domain-containing protein, partial [Brevibacterium sp. UMB10442]|nr:PcfJ domain-containing protein [Brevibacterium sp. UMB10442]
MKERENIIKKRKEAIEAEQEYKQLKAKFFGIEFTDGIIRIHVLESVQEHLEEGTAMHHCVYDAHYYSKPQSLIFSATKDGERIETIEVSLETM